MRQIIGAGDWVLNLLQNGLVFDWPSSPPTPYAEPNNRSAASNIDSLRSTVGETAAVPPMHRPQPEIVREPELIGDLHLKGHGNEADFLGFLQKLVPHRSITLPFEPFRFWLRIRGDIRN